MKQFSIRLDARLLAGLDAMVAEHVAVDRMDAIRKAVQLAILTPRDERVMATARWADLMDRESADAS